MSKKLSEWSDEEFERLDLNFSNTLLYSQEEVDEIKQNMALECIKEIKKRNHNLDQLRKELKTNLGTSCDSVINRIFDKFSQSNPKQSDLDNSTSLGNDKLSNSSDNTQEIERTRKDGRDTLKCTNCRLNNHSKNSFWCKECNDKSKYSIDNNVLLKFKELKQ